MKKRFLLCGGILWLVTNAHAAQVITPTQTTLSLSSGSNFSYIPLYNVTTPTTTNSTGLGMRIHFNSQALQWQGVTERFANGVLPLSDIMSDSENLDNDATTDQFVIAAWVDTTAQWTATKALPLPLLQAQFQAVSGFSGQTVIRTTAIATADDTTFTSTPMMVTVTPANTSGVKVQLRGVLQGAYNSSTGLMRDDLRSANLLPTAQPYAAWGYNGGETVSSGALAVTGNDAMVDWVLVELRDAGTPSTVIATQAALLQRDGDVVDALTQSRDLSFTSPSAGNYYIVLRHRNHLGVMTQAPLSLNSAAVPVDFSTTTTAVYGSNPTVITGTQRLLWAGDVNADDQLISDGQNNDKNKVLGALLMDADNTNAATNFQITAYHSADINLDGKVIFAGPSNEVNSLLGNVLLHPSNSSASTNYILKGTLP